MRITVFAPSGNLPELVSNTFDVLPVHTREELLAVIAARTSVPLYDMHLCIGDRIITEGQTMADVGVRPCDQLRMVLRGTIHITVLASTGPLGISMLNAVDVQLAVTVEELLGVLALCTTVPACALRLLYDRRIVKVGQTLEEVGVQEGDCLIAEAEEQDRGFIAASVLLCSNEAVTAIRDVSHTYDIYRTADGSDVCKMNL